MHISWCKIRKPLGFVENQAVLSGAIFGIAKTFVRKNAENQNFSEGK